MNPQTLFGTAEVAQILDVPEWRIKNFSEGAAYGLPPTLKVGSGRGSRRLYNVVEVVRMAVAKELLACGFSPESVGRAMGEIPASTLAPKDPYEWAPKPSDIRMLLCQGGRWRVATVAQARKSARNAAATSACYGVYVLNITGVRQKVAVDVDLYDKVRAFESEPPKEM